ncbi:MAG: hypothetical protein ACJ76N_02845 [Thermoanaerobaculia bacterium]
MSNNSQRNILATWDKVLAATQANQEDLAIVEEPRVQLEASVKDLRTLLAERARLSSEMLRKTREMWDLIDRGNALVIRIRAGAKSRYGIHSEKLEEFGIAPVYRRKPPRDRPAAACRKAGAPRNPTAP